MSIAQPELTEEQIAEWSCPDEPSHGIVARTTSGDGYFCLNRFHSGINAWSLDEWAAIKNGGGAATPLTANDVAIARLDGRDQLIATIHANTGYSVRHIAQITGTSKSTVMRAITKYKGH